MTDPKAVMAKADEAFKEHLAAITERQNAMRSNDDTWESTWRALDARVAETDKAYQAVRAELGVIFESVFGVHPILGIGHIRC